MDPLDLADRIRRDGGGSSTDAHVLHRMCEDAANRGDITHDQITVTFRHLAYHAGIIKIGADNDLHFCPVCGEPLDTVGDQ